MKEERTSAIWVVGISFRNSHNPQYPRLATRLRVAGLTGVLSTRDFGFARDGVEIEVSGANQQILIMTEIGHESNSGLQISWNHLQTVVP